MDGMTKTREQLAGEAYEKTYEGPWGLKASEEDALFSVLQVLYPDQFPTFETVRESAAMQEIADWLYEELSSGQYGSGEEIAAVLVPRIDEAMRVGVR